MDLVANWTKHSDYEKERNQPPASGDVPAVPVAPASPVRNSKKPVYAADGFIDSLFEPRPWKSWLYLTAGLFPSMYIVQRSNSAAEQIVCVCIALGGLVLGAGNEASVWITRLDDSEWHRQAKRWAAGKNVETQVATIQLDPTYQPVKRVNGMVYNQTTDVMPKINNEIRVACTLWDQRKNDLKVDLTEKFWVKSGRWPESREKFAEMKLRWQYGGAIKRKNPENKSSEHIPDDWDVIQKIKRGYRLPPPPAGYIG